MLEDKIAELIVALKAHTAALLGKAAPATATAQAKSAPKITFDQVKAAVVKVKDAKGKPAAQMIIRNSGKASELAAIKPAQYADVMQACEEALAEDEPADPGDEDTL